MEVLRNNKVIGFSNYYFNHENNKMIVKNETNFAVEMAGIKIFSIIGNSEEVYKNEKLISFKSSTIQNKKKKYVNLIYDEVKEQSVKLIGKDEIVLNGKKYKLFKFNLKSTNQNLPKDKKLDFDIWLEPNEGLIFKVQYNRLGNWEYKIKNFE